MDGTPGSAADGQRRPFAAHPPDWRIVETAGAGPFVSRVVYEDTGGQRLEWTSRRHRTGGGLRAEGAGHPAVAPAHTAATPVVRLLGWWIGVLFMIGSTAFALGSMPFFSTRVDPRAVAMTFVVGAIFFTSAAALQHLQTLRARRTVARDAVPDPRGPVARLFEPGRIDWWATAVQLVGTVFFNITTIAALNDALDTHEAIVRVWAPDALGSICFLVASELALLEVCHRWWCRAGGDVGRRIARLNMVGSIFFGASAITSFILPSTGEVIDAEATNAFTFLGAVCFLLGAWLVSAEARATRAAS
ncbi:MAG: hypothetical protein AB7V62_01600 [Thermoleophilia bacterium]